MNNKKSCYDIKEQEAFNLFKNAKEGSFNGFEFATIFHEKIAKKDALIHDVSNEQSICRGIKVGADGVDVYFFCKPDQARKQVHFNRSTYIF